MEPKRIPKQLVDYKLRGTSSSGHSKLDQLIQRTNGTDQKARTLILMTIMITVLWDVRPRRLGEIYQPFEGTICLHFQDRKLFFPEDGGSKFLQNINNFLSDYTRHHNPKYNNLHIHRRDNLNSCVLILSSHLCLCLSSGLLSFKFSKFLQLAMRATMSQPSHSPLFGRPDQIL
jgi:hypothetical protein